MEGGSSREPFGFAMDVISLEGILTTVKTWVVTALQLKLTPSFIAVDIFALVVPLISS